MAYFLVNADNLIVNIIVWDGVEQYDPTPFKVMPYVDGGEVGQPYPV